MLNLDLEIFYRNLKGFIKQDLGRILEKDANAINLLFEMGGKPGNYEQRKQLHTCLLTAIQMLEPGEGQDLGDLLDNTESSGNFDRLRDYLSQDSGRISELDAEHVAGYLIIAGENGCLEQRRALFSYVDDLIRGESPKAVNTGPAIKLAKKRASGIMEQKKEQRLRQMGNGLSTYLQKKFRTPPFK